MIKTEHIDLWGFEGAIRGARNPMNSWAKSDSVFSTNSITKSPIVILGQNDRQLLVKLCKAGTEHRKYLRQIYVSMDITAPLYWWKQFDTYKVGTTSNSCSTMHKLAYKEFGLEDFSYEHMISVDGLKAVIRELNYYRDLYLDFENQKENFEGLFTRKDVWWQMIQLLPSSYNQKRTVTFNYENVLNMIKQRSGHKLDEWNDLIEIMKGLPLIEELI